jgi:hypothetical protein
VKLNWGIFFCGSVLWQFSGNRVLAYPFLIPCRLSMLGIIALALFLIFTGILLFCKIGEFHVFELAGFDGKWFGGG